MSEAADGVRRVAAMGDIHVRDNHDVGALRDLFGEISRAADVLVLCGDLTDHGTPKEAEVLVEALRGASVPVVGVLGNHDFECGRVDEVRKILCDGGLKLLEGSSVEVDGIGFVGVKGFAGGFGARMLGSFGEPAIKTFVAESVQEAMQLEIAMRQVKAPKSVVVLHYAPIQETVEGEPPEIYPFLGSSRLAETIDRFEVNAIVHGHAHRGRYEGRTPRGAPVFNVAYHIEKPTGRPYAVLEI
ncbi:metallophosphoesterase family protein [Chthonobacter albigriseus]|uniref:metallophosphoesterase family protein n=1 Tax=Chthonobacter albigriseus TaxID=1683161 RepID=UPI001FCE6285|nr:metallophosphoesterase [Chthonobacter albigriseus]